MKGGAIGEFSCDTPAEASQVALLMSSRLSNPSTKTGRTQFPTWQNEEIRALLESKTPAIATRDKRLRQRTRGAIFNAMYVIRTGRFFSPRFKATVEAVRAEMMATSGRSTSSMASRVPVEA